MTALLGIWSRKPAVVPPRELVGDPAFEARGCERSQWWTGDHCALYAARDAWESDAQLAGSTLMANSEGIVVAADASLYYRSDLLRALSERLRQPPSDHASPAELILAAYQAWGRDCAEHLEGDWSFLVWDAHRETALIARDFVGRRPLFYAEMPGGLIVGSVARTIARHDAVASRPNRAMVAAAIGGLLGGSLDSGFEGVRAVPQGATMAWSAHEGLRTVRQWQPPKFAFEAREATPFHEAATELCELLTDATRERLTRTTTCVWLSGGADSTAVFGAAQRARRSLTGAQVAAVSISYPAGDGAREDDHISAVVGQWGSRVHWIDSESVSLFGDLERKARLRDDPYAHTYEEMNRTLARESVRAGARVAFDGYGGDQLFQTSDGFLGDLMFRLRWITALRGLREMEMTDVKSVARRYLVPYLPRSVRDVLAGLRGPGSLRVSAEQTIPDWLTPSITRERALRECANPEPERHIFEGLAAHESRWYLSSPYFGRAVSWATTFALGEGAEVRSPILDGRIIRFAGSRPVYERTPLGGTKKLLREASRDLVPDSVRATRAVKTGIPKGYFHRQMRAGFDRLYREVFGGPAPSVRLADLAIVDLSRLAQAKVIYEKEADHQIGIRLFLTLQAELWLRSIG